tara:strand:- start:112 stop:1314 length:1203 start_codon:yes stop_codon:yes gene_type:complete
MQNHINPENPIAFSPRSGSLRQIDPRQRAWIEVDTEAIAENARIIKQLIGKDCLLMAVVKADGYGHGSCTVARAALRGGARNLGVATLQEGIELRQSGLNCPILVLGNLISKQDFRECIEWNLTPTLSGMREAIICQNLSEIKGHSYKLKVHFKVDTGMTRLGCDLREAPMMIKEIARFKNLELEGIYSHLALADQDIEDQLGAFTDLQRKRFDVLLRKIRRKTISSCFHLANSAGTLSDSRLHYNMVRVGLSLYGHKPNEKISLSLNLKPALSVKARVTLVRDVPSGTGVGYGHNFITTRKSRLAVVAIGYADGVSRALSGKIQASINGKLFPQVGSITMDQLVLDITTHPDIKVGSIVTLLGKDKDVSISPYQWSSLIRSIPWEILCGFKHRLPRLVI